MMNIDTDICRGDIFYISQDGHTPTTDPKPGRPGIIVSNEATNKYSPNVEIVYLTSQEKKPLPTHAKVMAKVLSTALCENIRTIQKSQLGDLITSCTAKEMEDIDKALLISLGITEVEAPIEHASSTSSAVIERDLYKGLYEQLLEKMIGGK